MKTTTVIKELKDNEEELNPEFILKMRMIANQKSIKIKDFGKRYGLR